MKTVLVCIPPDSAARRGILTGFFRCARQMRDWDIEMLASLADSSAWPKSIRSKERPIDGVITCEDIPPALCPFLSPATSVVAVAFPAAFTHAVSGRVSHVDCDNAAIGAVGARHYLSLGTFNSHGFVHTKSLLGDAREQGFRDMLTARGHPCQVFEISYPVSDADRETLTDWLLHLPKPAAVMAFYDVQARLLLRICRAAGIAVPHEVSVIGVDNDELLCESESPSLSSIAPDHEAVGFAAAEELSRLLRKSTAKGRSRAVGIPQVVERESTRFVSPAVCLVRAAVEFIHDHAADGISVSDVAKRVGVSRRLLDLRFREVENESVRQAIERRRLDLARTLLRRSHYTLTAIAQRCGYAHVKSFEKAFSKKMGIPAGRYRARKEEVTK